MAKTKISEYSATPADNTDISNINIAEGCSPANVNNAIRSVMAQLKDQQAGTSGDSFTVGGNLAVTGTSTLTGAVTATAGVTGNLTGNVTGNLTGNVTGNVTGNAATVTNGVYLTSSQTLTNKTLTSPILTTPTVTNYTETVYTNTGNTTVSLDNGTVQKITTNGNNTITLPSSVTGKSYVVIIAYGGTHTVTWAGGSTIKWNNNTEPSQTSTNGKFDIFTFFCDGTNTYGSTFGKGF